MTPQPAESRTEIMRQNAGLAMQVGDIMHGIAAKRLQKVCSCLQNQLLC